MKHRGRAVVVGAGPNGLSAAIVAAHAGYAVDVFEAEPEPGGAARTLELTLPGFRHDFGSAVHPMAAGSPFFQALPLADYGLEWIHSSAPLAHPLDDGTAVVLEHSLPDAASALGEDGRRWTSLIGSFAEHWGSFAPDILEPVFHLPRHPLRVARFGSLAALPASVFANRFFRSPRTKALFAGMAAHSFLALDEPFSSAIGLVLGAAAHAVGWPIPRGGAGSITRALVAYLESLKGTVYTSHRVESLSDLGQFDLALCDVTPHQLLEIAGERFTPVFQRLLQRFQYGPGAFKVDYALSSPIPWKACRMCAGSHGAFGRNDGGDLRLRERDAQRNALGPSVRVARPTQFVRSKPRTCRKTYCLGLLSCAQRIDDRHAALHRGPD